MFLLVILFAVITVLIIILNRYMKEARELSSNMELDEYSKVFPGNLEICKEMQKIVDSKCDIKLDDSTKSSAYIFLNNQIILSNNEDSKKNYSRVLFIAHECIHSIQPKKVLLLNFILFNLMNLYNILTLIILLLLDIKSYEIIAIAMLISFAQVYVKISLEVDAVYRSLILSEEYLKDKNCDKLIERYKYIIPKTISVVYISYILLPLIYILLLTLAMIL